MGRTGLIQNFQKKILKKLGLILRTLVKTEFKNLFPFVLEKSRSLPAYVKWKNQIWPIPFNPRPHVGMVIQVTGPDTGTIFFTHEWHPNPTQDEYVTGIFSHPRVT
jgi:hypothetical protein